MWKWKGEKAFSVYSLKHNPKEQKDPNSVVILPVVFSNDHLKLLKSKRDNKSWKEETYLETVKN